MIKSKYKAVIFDFDDTLVETYPNIWKLHKHVAKNFYGIDLTDETLHEHWGKPLHTLTRELYKDSDTFENMMSAIISVGDQFPLNLHPGSLETVDELLNSGIKVGILSSSTQFFISQSLDKFNFPKERFTVIQTAEDTPVHKPDPAVFLPILKKFKEAGIAKEEIIYVGDALHDMKAAHDAGLDFLAVTTGIFSEDTFRKHGAKYIVKDISEVADKIINQ